MPDLSTTYLGLKLHNPLIASASPLTHELGNIRALEDAGAAAMVLPSVFQEQIEQEAEELETAMATGAESVAEASSFMPPITWHSGSYEMLETIRRARAAVGIPVLAAIPADEDIRRKSANYQIIGVPGGQWAHLFEALAVNVAEAPPVRPKPLTSDGLLGLFSADQTGAAYKLQPASQADMRGAAFVEKRTLEIVYDEV